MPVPVDVGSLAAMTKCMRLFLQKPDDPTSPSEERFSIVLPSLMSDFLISNLAAQICSNCD